MVLCVLAIVLLSMSVIPTLLDWLTPGTRPGVRLGVWLATVVTVLGAALAVPLITAAGGHPVTAALESLPMAVLTSRIFHRYKDIMRTAHDHADAVRLVGRSSRDVRARTPVVTIDSPIPLVYCLSGHPGLIVTTTGARDRLTPTELEAVVAHEEAHLRQCHAQLRAVLQAITAVLWWSGFFLHAARRIADATELCADLAASRRHDRYALARALMALAPAPVGTLGGALAGAPERLEHLLHQPRRCLPRHLVMTLVAAGPVIGLVMFVLGCPLMPMLATR